MQVRANSYLAVVQVRANSYLAVVQVRANSYLAVVEPYFPPCGLKGLATNARKIQCSFRQNFPEETTILYSK